MATVSLKSVKKVYEDGFVAVHGFDLEIRDKEFVVLVGPSGCGKSTTLRMVAGLEDISSGEIYIGDRLVNDLLPKDRDIAMVFQNYALYPHMSVFENLAFSLRLARKSREEIAKRVGHAAEILGITSLLERKPRALSGGQRQRVAIGRAIVREPQVFLMDEPLSNLDAKLRNQMRAEIIKLRSRINTTFIYVTHDQTEAMTLGDRIVIMRDGFVQQIGSPQEVFDRPANIFVASFIGTPQMNFLKAELKISEKGTSVEVCGVSIELPRAIAEKLAVKQITSQPVILGIRPEHLVLCASDAPGAIKGSVDVCEMLGSELHLHLVSGGQEIVLREQTVDLEERFRGGFAAGETVFVSLRSELVHLFDPESEKSLL